MSNNSLFTATVISVVYLLFKLMEMKFVLKEELSIKTLFRETLIVYISILGGRFLLKQFYILNMGGASKKTEVFTDNPSF